MIDSTSTNSSCPVLPSTASASSALSMPGNLHEDRVVALPLDRRLANAEPVDTVAHDQFGAVHDRCGHRRRRRLLGRQDDRQATLDVEALGDLLGRWPEQHPRRDHEHRS